MLKRFILSALIAAALGAGFVIPAEDGAPQPG
jgi:hypothetical protein